jgi:lipoate-protein ligase A
VRSDAVDVARRVTGGRALLHDGELTYCVVAPNAAIRGEARASGIFLGISRALSAALRSIGVDAEVARGARGGRPAGAAAPCLLSTTRYELAARGRKIAGSAQRTMRDAFLQHGSILLTPGSARIARYARGPQCSLAGRITSVSEELGREIPARELRSAVWDAFAETFRIDWAPFALSPGDEGEVRRMALAKGREFPDAAKREARCMVPAGEREFPDAAELDVRRAARAGEREFRDVPEQEVRR